MLEKYGKKNVPVVVAVTKTDITQPEKLMPELAKLNRYDFVKEVYCVSARKGRNISTLRNGLKKYLTGDSMYFQEDDITDKSRSYLVAEIIREKVLLNCDEEIPHGVGIQLNKMQYDEERDEWDIDANVIVEKASHKPIVLGKQGAMIKSIGRDARRDMEKLLESHVFLTLWVKVKEDWRNRPSVMNELGYKI